uniref:Uncharacterized protein n=1 Tax=Timema poppense TaxID=170557 RepID=A0A7R9D2M9_TIMPO|nr:unnamed protein product [Timema poppensis]
MWCKTTILNSQGFPRRVSRLASATSDQSLLCGQFLRSDCDWRPECASSISTLRLRPH